MWKPPFSITQKERKTPENIHRSQCCDHWHHFQISNQNSIDCSAQCTDKHCDNYPYNCWNLRIFSHKSAAHDSGKRQTCSNGNINSGCNDHDHFPQCQKSKHCIILQHTENGIQRIHRRCHDSAMINNTAKPRSRPKFLFSVILEMIVLFRFPCIILPSCRFHASTMPLGSSPESFLVYQTVQLLFHFSSLRSGLPFPILPAFPKIP